MAAEKNPFAKFLTHFAAGHVLFKEGEEGDEMYIIQSGRVAIKKKVKDGDSATLAVLEKGDFFGEMAILERLSRSATAEVVEEGDIIVINGETFGDMIKTNPEIAVRMLVNLKRLYVRMRSFPQARFISDLLLTVDPSAIAELRDRGLLAYHLEDFAAALRDLETYLRLLPRRASTSEAGDVENAGPAETEPAGEDAQIWEHVKALRRRVAGFN